MDSLLDEVDAALDTQLYYLAVLLSLTLPDICSALESFDGETRKPRYQAWVDTWFLPEYPMMTADDLYSLRCGVVHQGRFGHRNMQFSRVIFSLPDGRNNVFHQNILNDALNLDAVQFCRDMQTAVRSWWATQATDPHVQSNIPNLMQYRPDGLSPYMIGVPVIS